LIAALEMLDTQHRRLPQRRVDPNVYALGEIAGHNIVIVGMPQTGNCSAATVMAHARWTFPNLRFCLLVGIGGGVPVTTDNGRIRLGDVVVSKPTGPYPGVMQYHRGKAQAGHFEPTGALPPPPAVLLSAAQALAADRARSATDPLASNLARIDTTIEGLRKYQSPGRAQDHLYRPTYPHQVAGRSCSECMCDPARRVRVPRFRGDDRVAVHRGTIASGELVMRSGKLRDKLAMEYDVLCFETEAAGVLTDFPCMVVRGISDYSDSHKNDLWQGYAAATAAAYARELFSYIPHNHEDDPES
jgi:nucleoside phosphorylase